MLRQLSCHCKKNVRRYQSADVISYKSFWQCSPLTANLVYIHPCEQTYAAQRGACFCWQRKGCHVSDGMRRSVGTDPVSDESNVGPKPTSVSSSKFHVICQENKCPPLIVSFAVFRCVRMHVF